MKIDLKRLKIHPRETESFYFSVPGNDHLLTDLGGKFLAPVEVDLVLENTGTIFAGRGRVKTLVQLPCSRCLQDFAYPIDAELEITLVENNRFDQFNADEGFVFFSGDEADITPGVEEAIFMALPISPLCQLECKGLCPVCGQDKNIQTCSCEEDKIDPRWEKLNNLK